MIHLLAFLRPKRPQALLLGVLLFAVLLGLAYAYLSSETFQQHLRASVIRYLESVTRGTVRVAHFRFDPLEGNTTLTGLSIARADAPEAPFLMVERAVVAFSLLSPLSERTLTLRSLILEKPQLNLELLQTSSGLGQREESHPGSANFVENLFRIAIGHLELRSGALLLKAQSIPLELDLQELQIALQFDQAALHYLGDLAFQGGRLAMRSWKADRLAMKTRLTFYSQGVEISDGQLQMSNSSVRFSGLIANLYSPDLWLDIALQGTAEEFQDTFLGQDLGVRGPFQADGRLVFTAGRFGIRGRFSSPEASYWRIRPSHLSGEFDLDPDGIALRSASFELLRGKATGNLLMSWGQHGFSGQGKFKMIGLDARSTLSTILQTELPIASAIGGTVTLGWTPQKDSFTVRAEALLAPIQGTVSSPGRAGKVLDLSGSASMTYAHDRFLFDKATLQMPGGTLDASGWMALNQQAAIDLNYRGDSLQTTAGQLATFFKWDPDSMAPWLENARAEEAVFSGRFAGMGAASPISGHLMLSKPSWKTLQADAAHAELSWNRDRLELQPWGIETTDWNARGSLVLQLSERSGPPGTMELKGVLDRLPVAPLVQVFSKETYPLDGFISGTIGLSGKFPELRGQADLSVGQPSLWGETLERIDLGLTLAGKRISLERLAGHLGPRRVLAKGWCDLESNGYQVSASGKGWSLQQLLADRGREDLGLEGELDFTVQGEGSLDHPLFNGTVTASQLRLGTLLLDEPHAELSYEARQLKAQAAARLGGGKLGLRATADWTVSPPSLSAEVTVASLNPLALAPIRIPEAAPPLDALLNGSIAVSGPLNQPEQWAATSRFPSVILKLRELEFRNQGAFEAHYRDGKLNFDATRFSGHRNSFTLSGAIALRPRISTDLRIVSRFNLDLFNTLIPGATLGGTADVAISLQGEPSNPRIFGTSQLNDATASYKELNYSLSNISGLVSFGEHLAGVHDLKGTLSTGGRITLNGSVTLERLAVKDFVLQARIEQALLRVPQGFRTRSNADLVLRGDPTSQLLMGEVDVLDALYSRNVDFLNHIAVMAGNSGAAAAQGSSLLDSLSLNLVVGFSNGIVIKTETVRLSADSQLRILGPATRPSLLGRISANAGEVFFMGNRYEITKGGVEFVNPMRIEPQFDLEAKTNVKGYRINLLLRGTPESIQPEFRSEPPLPVLDLITLLSTGVTSDELMGDSSRGRNNLGMAASNILAGGLAQQVENRVQRMLGFSQFKIDPLVSARTSNPTARVTMERRLSNNLSVIYSTDITTSKTQIVVVEYYLTPDYSLVASRDENGHFGLDLRIQRKF